MVSFRSGFARFSAGALAALTLAACGAPATTAPVATDVAPTAATQATTAPVATESATAPAATAATNAAPTAATGNLSGDLVIYSGRSEALIQPVLDLFSQQYPDVTVQLKAGSNNELAAALLEEKANPQASVFITTDMLTAANLAAEGVFAPYEAPASAQVDDAYRDPNNLWTAFTARARVIMYNKELVTEADVPTTMAELADPKWQGQVAAAASSNGSMQAQITAMRELAGEDATRQWLEGMIANNVTFLNGHTDVRKAVGAGEFKLGLVNHYYYHLQLAEASDNNVGVAYVDQGEGQMGTIVNTTAGGVVAGGPNEAAARAFIEFLLTPEAQELFASANYEYPLIDGVALADGVRPLSEFRIADVTMRDLATNLPETQQLIQDVNLP